MTLTSIDQSTQTDGLATVSGEGRSFLVLDSKVPPAVSERAGDGILPLRPGSAVQTSGSDEESRRQKAAEEKEEQLLRESTNEERRSQELKAGLHPLQHRYVLWYTRRVRTAPGARLQTAYEDNIKRVVDFGTVEGFWGCYCHLARPANLPLPTDFHLFREGIRPLWEDSGNKSGGKWIVRFKKGVVGRFWEDCVFALVGDQLEQGDSICGAVLSVRYNEDIISIWNSNASENQAIMALRDSLKRHLHLPQNYIMEYKPHDASLKDNSSFRNTWRG